MPMSARDGANGKRGAIERGTSMLDLANRTGAGAIESIDVTMVQIALPRDFGGSTYSVTHKNALITRVRTKDGLVGEAVNGEGQADVLKAARKLLVDELAPALIGQDASRIERCWETMFARTHKVGFDKRVMIRAIACIDSALWDALGKAAGLSLHKLWGGYAEELPIIAIGGQYIDGAPPERYGEEMLEYRELGLAGCKFKVGGLGAEADAARVRAARKAVGGDFILCVDANRGWPRQTALDFARRVADQNVRWFEEPCHWNNDRRDMAAVRMLTGLPVVAGQSEVTAEACRDLITDGAIDICNIDASWGGGPTPWVKIAHLAAAHGVAMAHHGEPVIGGQLLAAIPNGTYVETHHPARDPIFHQMIIGRGRIAKGMYTIPTAPGWGIEFDADFVAHYSI
jgi:D-galactarolactone cycloisomerase